MNSGAREVASSQRGTQKSSKFVIEHIHVTRGISKSKVCGDRAKLIRATLTLRILPSGSEARCRDQKPDNLYRGV